MPMRPRRSMLYIPGNRPGMIQNCRVFGADSVLLDLEDAIALSEKDAARRLTAHLLKAVDFGHLEVTVRINGADTPYFRRDLEEIVPARPAAIRLPKCQSPQDVLTVDALISELEEKHGIPAGSIKIHAMIETALGIQRAYDIASASPRVTALTLGGQDLTADLGVQKTKEGWELFYARSAVVLAAKAAGVDVFDTVWADINDPEGLLRESRQVMGLGFTGKAAIHPSQIPVIHKAYMPEEKELRKARRIVEAAEEAKARGIGVISVDGKMVDEPVVRRAHRLMELASFYGEEEE